MLLPARGRRSRRDPDEDQAEAAARLRLNRTAFDALIWAYQAPTGTPPWLQLLFDKVIVREHLRLRPGGEPVMVPPKTGRDWLFDQAHDLDGCDQVLAFREAQCGAFHVRPTSCKVRICANCERVRSAALVRVYRAILSAVPAARRSFLVLTKRNVPRLAPGLDDLAANLRSLRRRPIFRGGRCRMRDRQGRPFHRCEARYCSRWTAGRHRADRNCPDYRHPSVAGGVITTEVTYNAEERSWHPHANLLLDAPYIEQAELSDLWRGLTCTEAPHCRRGWCPAECDEGSMAVWIRQVDPDRVREAIKYVTKATDLVEGDDPTQLAEFLFATRGRRMVQGFGSFYNVELEEPEDEESVTLAVPVVGVFDARGEQIFRRYSLPRWCRHCGHDTALGDDCTYEQPIVVPRIEVRLRHGVASWRPPPRIH